MLAWRNQELFMNVCGAEQEFPVKNWNFAAEKLSA
jgi:hypothetical protein